MTKIAVFGAGTWGIALARLLAVNGREPTTVEQLDLLAGLCERGFVTREEFEQAKVRLLGKI